MFTAGSAPPTTSATHTNPLKQVTVSPAAASPRPPTAGVVQAPDIGTIAATTDADSMSKQTTIAGAITRTPGFL